MKKLTLKELLQSNKNKKILFLGREGIFTVEEIQRFLNKYDIAMVSDYTNDVVGVVEHHMLNPVEEDISYMAYDDNVPIYKLADFEKLFSEAINDDELLMGVKLANDQERIFRLLGNAHIGNDLFVKLLGMYEWHENDEDNTKDRDVIMHTLRRYIKIKPNEEDLLYSSLTLKRLSREASDPRLLQALLRFPNITFLQKGKQRITLKESIATNIHIDSELIRRLMSLRDAGVDMYLAANTSTPLDILHKYAQRDDEEINQSLASNTNIDDIIFTSLIKKSNAVLQVMLWYQHISMSKYKQLEELIEDEELFASLGDNQHIDKTVLEKLSQSSNKSLLVNLAANDSVDSNFLEYIYKRNIFETLGHIAMNRTTPVVILEEIYRDYANNEDILISLSYNAATPVPILKELYEREEFKINKGLASNASVPMEILNVLKIDTRLRNELTTNETFVASITRSLGL